MCFSHFSSALSFFKTNPCNVVGACRYKPYKLFCRCNCLHCASLILFWYHPEHILQCTIFNVMGFSTHLTFNFFLLGFQFRRLISLDLCLSQKSNHPFYCCHTFPSSLIASLRLDAENRIDIVCSVLRLLSPSFECLNYDRDGKRQFLKMAHGNVNKSFPPK